MHAMDLILLKLRQVASVVSNSVRPHRWQPTRLPRPWDYPGKNTRVGGGQFYTRSPPAAQIFTQACQMNPG